MKVNIQILESYSALFRELVNERNLATSGPIKDALRLSRDEDWSFICSSMDIVDDAALALENFLKFGLDGPTKYNEDGEKYLRLYGLLSATYIQQQAILTLHILNTDSDSKKALQKIKDLKIRQVRHKIASHACDYLRQGQNKLESYVPVRLYLSEFCIGLFNSENFEIEKISLKDYLDEHINLMINFLDEIIEKSIKRIFRGQTKKINEFNERLKYLRIERDVGIVIHAPVNSKDDMITIIIRGSSPDKGENKQKTEN